MLEGLVAMNVTPNDASAAPTGAITRVGPYRVIRRIGSGGMASVFEAEDERLGQRIALKQLHPHIAERAGARERFVREGRAAARIRHPHVLQVFSLGEVAGNAYLAMELLEGMDLSALLGSEGRLSVERTLELMLPVIAGVAAAHDAGVIHRDLKPSNVFISIAKTHQRLPKVVDFGVSKLVCVEQDVTHLTETQAVVGTAAYMAPEQARSVRNTTFLSDQYSLGVILYQCLTGGLPFSGANVYEILQAVMTAPVVPPSQRVAELPRELDAVVLRALGREPKMRFASVRALGAALLPFASEQTRAAFAAELCEAEPSAIPQAILVEQPVSMPTGGTLQGTQSARRRRRGLSVAATLLAAVVLTAGTYHSATNPGASARPPRALASDAKPAPVAIAQEKRKTEAPVLPSFVPQSEVAGNVQAAQPVIKRRARPAAASRAAQPKVASSSGSAGAISDAPVRIGDNGAPILP